MYTYTLKNGTEIKTSIFVPPEYVSMLEDLRELKRDGQNPNKMTQKQKAATWTSLKMFGWVYPIIADKDGCFADGEQRVDTCIAPADGFDKDLEKTEEFYGPVLRLQVEDSSRRLLRQVLNKLKGTHDKLLDAEEFERIKTAKKSDELKALLCITDETLNRYDKLLHDAASENGAILDSTFEIVVKCKDEPEQKRIFDELKTQGYAVRILTL